jgi:hypothetical protein
MISIERVRKLAAASKVSVKVECDVSPNGARPLPKSMREMEVVFRRLATAGEMVAHGPMLTAFIRKLLRKGRGRRKTAGHYQDAPWPDEESSRIYDRLLHAVLIARGLDPEGPAENAWKPIDFGEKSA